MAFWENTIGKRRLKHDSVRAASPKEVQLPGSRVNAGVVWTAAGSTVFLGQSLHRVARAPSVLIPSAE
jgi:hypothetical protein